MITLDKALRSLNITGFSVEGEPTTEEEFNNAFTKFVGVDEGNVAITSNNPSDFGVTWGEITAEITRLQAEYNANQYARDRATQYAPQADQLDMLWHAIDQGIDLKQSDFYTGNKAVKDAHPKG